MVPQTSLLMRSIVLFIGFIALSLFPASEAALKKYQFDVVLKNVSRLCHAKPIVTVNGKFPGPTIYVTEGDSVIINVTNNAQYNMSIHWHGLKQFREWWNGDVEEAVKKGNKLGLPPAMSDAHTINGKPGPLFPYTHTLEVESGQTYLLRVINAALNDELFFTIAGHNMTVVEIDAVYVKPFTTNTLIITPGQTTNVLVTADRSPGRYFIGARAFMDAPIAVDNKTAMAILQYKGVPNTTIPITPKLPARNDTELVTSYNKKLRSLNRANVPLTVDRKLFYTIDWAPPAHYYKIKGVFSTDFPDRPPKVFNYTGVPLTANLRTNVGTRLSRVAFNSTVELVLQDTNLLSVESHPFHLHGYNFFVVGSGVGNFDKTKDLSKFNLVDPPERNTIAVPTGGWTAIRFRADNPALVSPKGDSPNNNNGFGAPFQGEPLQASSHKPNIGEGFSSHPDPPHITIEGQDLEFANLEAPSRSLVVGLQMRASVAFIG
ncbi:Laccase-11 [Acorus calamus]|uniref:laccase n=1 Tax=Acorus calamus TaxID=4465 RepID=A0AAV9FA42_ACOCL|nr:Laccase-11 [Acorus calamus]